MIIEREQISFHHICGLLLDHDTLTLSLQLKPISFFEESLQNTTAPPLQLCFNKNSSTNAHGKGFLEGWWQAIHALILLLIIAGCLVGHILICKMLCDGFILIHYFWFTFSFMTFLFFFLCFLFYFYILPLESPPPPPSSFVDNHEVLGLLEGEGEGCCLYL